MRPARLRAAARQLADALGYPILLGDLDGGILHETPALLALLEADREAELLRAAMLSLLEPESHANAPEVHETDGGASPACREVRTGNGRYLLRASLHALQGRRAPVVLVRVERMADTPRSEDHLREAFSLTRTEARVALLLGQGMSNTGIAQALAISPHTARRHTERVLFKLGIRSRAEVAARLFF